MSRRFLLTGAIVAMVGLGLTACSSDSTAPEPNDLRVRFALEAAPPVVHPAANPPIPERMALGRLLFFDPVLSGPQDVACATCHHPRFAWGDGRQLAIGVSGVGMGPERALTDESFHLVPRNSPSVLNTAFNGMTSATTYYDPDSAVQFWDGRAKSLETQATLPITSRVEMAGDAYSAEEAFDSVVARLRKIPRYEQLFRAAFIPEGDSANAGQIPSAITHSTYARSIACFERAIVGVNSPYDRYVRGDDNALTDAQKSGLELFFTDAGCAKCHSGPMFSDYEFHVLGVDQQGPGKSEPGQDYGRWEFTGTDADRWAFRTPTLRSVAITAPYMHDGMLNTLDEVIEFHKRGGGDNPDVPADRLDDNLTAITLTAAEKADLIAFLHALTDPGPAGFLNAVPESVPSGLEPPR